MSTETSDAYEKYYVPDSSKLAICATIGLLLSVFGAAGVMNDATFGDPAESSSSWTIMFLGLF
ncbi:MAG: cytochrome c oxidase subunit 3, partial [Pseudomonadota bacterium]